MESPRGRPGPEAGLLALGEQQAAIIGGGPDRTASEPPSGLRLSEEEEAENVGGASRIPRASPKTSSCSFVHPPEWEAPEEEPGRGGTPSGAGSNRGAPGPENDPHASSRRKEPEDRPASEGVCRRGSPGGGGLDVEQEKEDDDEAAAASRAGRSFSSRLQDSRSLDGPLELEGTELTALSVGCIQTYRDAVDSLGEAVDMSIKGMYTLLARCEELERALQPVQGLARQVRDIRRTLEVLEALCK
ncbi:hypothetical protein E2I00_019979 [Balaenoptera physalus]|uniref:BLOC-1-related complex subunit 6 C-terminal helix domain-containing protein n=1 Tax=Balaenoptera physalus TaxID=9770 RepID=A0A6A1Q6B4_BALPH|nr:hypothetical protein E2I00_019979 [Balaenoptera physalus]